MAKQKNLKNNIQNKKSGFNQINLQLSGFIFFSLGEALILPKPIRQIIIKNSQKLGINFSSYRKKGKKINDHYFVLSVKVIYLT